MLVQQCFQLTDINIYLTRRIDRPAAVSNGLALPRTAFPWSEWNAYAHSIFRPMRIPFSDPGERHYMSIMINEAQSSNIAKIYLKIESIENLEKNCPFDKMHAIQPNEIFSKYAYSIY